MNVLLALVAAAAYGVSDFVGGVAARRVAALRVVLVSYPLSAVMVLVMAPFIGGSLTVSDAVWGAVAGAAAGFAVWWFYLALAQGPMAVVSPLTAVIVAGLPVIVGLATGERPGPLAMVGVVGAIAAVVLVSRESPDDAAGEVSARTLRFTRTVAILTVGSGLAFGLTFIGLHEVHGGGLWPLAISRLAATAVVWVAAATSGQFQLPAPPVMRLAVGIALLDTVANAAMLFAFRGGMLSLVSVIGSLYPAATVLLAMGMLGERVGRSQGVGMILALASVAVISAAA